MQHVQWAAAFAGVGLALAVACGSSDEQTEADPTGGSAGTGVGGGSGSAGSAGSSGTTGGSAGTGNGGSSGSGGSAGSSGTGGSTSGVPTEPNLKVAFIGDSGDDSNFEAVLTLIKNEGAHFVLHQGDFDYAEIPDNFFNAISGVLGSEYPYFASVGNHDDGAWAGYAQYIKQRMTAHNVTPDDADFTDEMYSATFKGLKMVFVGQSGDNDAYAQFIDQQLSGDTHIWKICSWHKNQQAMQVGGKTNEMGWAVYETCIKHGAIIATGHEHSYERTKTLTSAETQTVDSTCSDPNQLCVAPGRSFVFVSGLGGIGIRDQERCLPTTYPYGCNGEWAFIYTSNQNAEYGALFIDFNVDGNPNKAKGYFKTIDNQVVDQFDITKQ